MGRTNKNATARMLALYLPFLVILVCSIFLAVLSVKTVRDEKSAILEDTTRRADTMAEGMRELLERGCDEIENGITSLLGVSTNAAELVSSVGEPSERARHLERVFVMDASCRLKYPVPFWRIGDEAPPYSDSVPVRLSMAEDLKVRGRLAEAEELAQHCVDDMLNGRIVCTLHQALFARDTLAELFGAEGGANRRGGEWLAGLDAFVVPQKIARELRKKGTLEKASARRFVFELLPVHGLVAVKWISSARTEAVVALMNPDVIRQDMEKGLRNRLSLEKGAEYVVYDREDRLFLTSGAGRISHPQSEATLDTRLPFSRVALRLTESGAQAKRIENRRFVSISVIAVMLLVIGYSLVFVLRLMMREKEQADMKTSFVSSVSHEMRLPLSAIAMVGEMFRLGKVKDEEQANEYYNILAEETEHLTLLTNKILDFSRMEAGRRPYNPVPEDVAPLLEEAVRRFLRCAGNNRKVKLEVARDLPRVAMDREGFLQILFNLVDNACKHAAAAEDRRIHVTARMEPGWLLIEVSDHGPGVPAAERRRIFDPFFRAEPEQTREHRGVGLGLAIATRLARALGGRLQLVGEPAPGGRINAVFELRLPLLPE